MARNHGNSHVRFTLAESLAHRATLLGIPLQAAAEERFASLTRESIEKQRKIEARTGSTSRPTASATSTPELLGPSALEK